MDLLLALGSIAAVVLLGMVLLAPLLERRSWEKKFACPPPKPETPRYRPVEPAPHRNSLVSIARTFVLRTYLFLRAATQ